MTVLPEPGKVMDADLRRHDQDGAVRASIVLASDIRQGFIGVHGDMWIPNNANAEH